MCLKHPYYVEYFSNHLQFHKLYDMFGEEGASALSSGALNGAETTQKSVELIPTQLIVSETNS